MSFEAEKGPKQPKIAFFDKAMLITCKIFKSKVPGLHFLILVQYPRHWDELIEHICENGSRFWSLGAHCGLFVAKHDIKWSIL